MIHWIALNVSAGNVYIGFVGKGQTVTVYFTVAQSSALVSAANFASGPGMNGKIDLKLDYQYYLTFGKNPTDNKNEFAIYGVKLGGSDTAESWRDFDQRRQSGHEQRNDLFAGQSLRFRVPDHRQRRHRRPRHLCARRLVWLGGGEFQIWHDGWRPDHRRPDQFRVANSSNRALGLLATSSTKGTAFGARFLNASGITLTRMNLQFTGEVWRQSNVPKTLQFYYFVDLTGTNAFTTNATAFLPALNVNFPTVAADTGGVAVDGTASLNQTNLAVLDQAITNWPPGAALWLVWQMTDSPARRRVWALTT